MLQKLTFFGFAIAICGISINASAAGPGSLPPSKRTEIISSNTFSSTQVIREVGYIDATNYDVKVLNFYITGDLAEKLFASTAGTPEELFPISKTEISVNRQVQNMLCQQTRAIDAAGVFSKVLQTRCTLNFQPVRVTE